MSDKCTYFTYFAASDRCHGYSSCSTLDDSRCFGTCFSGDEACTEEEECVRPGKCENTAVVDARAEASLMDCAQFMNRRPDANFFSFDVDTQVSSYPTFCIVDWVWLTWTSIHCLHKSAWAGGILTGVGWQLGARWWNDWI